MLELVNSGKDGFPRGVLCLRTWIGDGLNREGKGGRGEREKEAGPGLVKLDKRDVTLLRGVPAPVCRPFLLFSVREES